MLRLREIMTTDVVTISPELTLRDAMALFATRHVSGALVVLGSRKVVGVVSLTDLAEFAASDPGVPTLRRQQAEEEWGAPAEPVEGEEVAGNVASAAGGGAAGRAEASGTKSNPHRAPMRGLRWGFSRW